MRTYYYLLNFLGEITAALLVVGLPFVLLFIGHALVIQ